MSVINSLGQGFAPYILNSLKEVAKENNPADKLRIPGYMNYLMVQGSKEVVSLNTRDGNRRTVSISQKQRLTEGFVEDTISCDTTNIVPTFETDVDVDITKSISLYLDEDTLAKYPDSQRQQVGIGGASSLDREMFDRISTASNTLLNSIDRALLAKQVAAFGVNVVSGNNAATSINLEKNTDFNTLQDGETKLLTDYAVNENMGRPAIIGAGNMLAYFMQQGAKSANQAGIDTRFFANSFDFFYDENVQTSWGANEFSVMSPNSTQMIEYFQYMGARGGDRKGDSTYFTMLMPIVRGDEIRDVRFDVQLRYISCPTSFTDGYYGTTLNVERGWQMIISKQLGLFTIPEGSYRATDNLTGNRGTYRYLATNDCTTCP